MRALCSHLITPGLLAGFAVLVALTQMATLGTEYLNPDEYTFAVMGADILDGHLPYTQMIDNKPPGIFLMLAASMAVFGENLIAIRLVGDISILISAIGVFALARRMTDRSSATLAALFLIGQHVITYGAYTSSELPAGACVIWALWCLTHPDLRRRHLICAGLLLSVATLTRSNLAVLALGVGLWIAVSDIIGKNWRILPFTLAGLAPLGLLFAVYSLAGQLDVLRLALIEVPLNYAGQAGLLDAARGQFEIWRDFALSKPNFYTVFSLGALAGLVLSCLRGPHAPGWRRRDGGIVTLSAALIVLSIAASGNVLPSYPYQLYPVLAVYIARAGYLLPRLSWVRWGAAVVITGFLIVDLPTPPSQLWAWVRQSETLWARHEIRQASLQMAEDMKPEDRVLALDHHLILLYLDQKPLSPAAAHPGNLVSPDILSTLVEAGYVEADVFDRLLASRPEFIVTRGEGRPFYTPDPEAFDRMITADYETYFKGSYLTVYRRSEAESADRSASPRSTR